MKPGGGFGGSRRELGLVQDVYVLKSTPPSVATPGQALGGLPGAELGLGYAAPIVDTAEPFHEYKLVVPA